MLVSVNSESKQSPGSNTFTFKYKETFLKVLTTHKNEVMDVLTSLIVVIVSNYMCIKSCCIP